MIDSHCHLDHEPMFSDLKNVVTRSKENGVEKILSICTTNDSFKKIIEIIKFDPIIYGTFGIHPHEADSDEITKNEIIKNVSSNEKIIAIGESGWNLLGVDWSLLGVDWSMLGVDWNLIVS